MKKADARRESDGPGQLRSAAPHQTPAIAGSVWLMSQAGQATLHGLSVNMLTKKINWQVPGWGMQSGIRVYVLANKHYYRGPHLLYLGFGAGIDFQ